MERRQFNIVLQSKPNKATGKYNLAAMVYTWPDNERLGGVWLNPRDEQSLKSAIRFDSSGRSVRFNYKKFQDISNRMERKAAWKKMLTKISEEDDNYEAAKVSLLPEITKEQMSGDPGTPEFWASTGGYSTMMKYARRAIDAGLGGKKMTLREAKEALNIKDVEPSGTLAGGPSIEQKNDLLSHLGGPKAPSATGTPSTAQTVSTGAPNKTSGKMAKIQIRGAGTFLGIQNEDHYVTISDGSQNAKFRFNTGDKDEEVVLKLLKLAGSPAKRVPRAFFGEIDPAQAASVIQSGEDSLDSSFLKHGYSQSLQKLTAMAGQTADVGGTAGSTSATTSAVAGTKPGITKPGMTPETLDPNTDYELGERAGIMRYQRSLMDDNYKRKIGSGDRAVSNVDENFGRRRGLGYSANTGAYNLLNRIGITDAKREDVLRNKGRKKLEKANLAGSRYLDLRDLLQGERDIYDEQQKTLELNPTADLSQGSLGNLDSFELRRLRRRMNRQERKQGRKMRKFRKKVGRANNLVKKEGRKRAQELNRSSADKRRGRNNRI